MRKIKTAVLGAGFMGRVHVEQIRRLGNVEVVALAAVSDDEATRFGAAYGIERTTTDWLSLLKDPAIDAVHICTPNALHAPMAKAALECGKAVLCEKPLTTSVAEAQELVDLAAAKGLPNAINHNLRYYPAVQQIRQMIAHGDLGEILIVNGSYFQDWLLYDTDYNWRVEREANGALRCMGDIGSHWMDMIQHLTGLKINSLCADLQIVHPTRKKPKGAVETFTGKKLSPDDYNEIPIDTDDAGCVLLHLGERAHGNFAVSQISAGCKNRFQFEIFGSKKGVAWNQESPDQLWIGERNEANRLIVKDGSLFYPEAAAFADLPGGHSEGYDDAHKQLYRRFYQKVANPNAAIDYPTFADGLRTMRLLAAVLESHETRSWKDIPD